MLQAKTPGIIKRNKIKKPSTKLCLKGTIKNLQLTETLKKSWSIIEQNLHENSLFLFR